MSLTTWLTLGEAAWVIGLAGWIILERRSPTATLAWVFALAWLPLVGIAVYLFVGPRRLRRKKLRYRRSKSRLEEISGARKHHPQEAQAASAAGVQSRPLVLLAERAGQPPPLRARRVEIFSQGDDCYRAMERAISEAKHHVHLEYYIWEPDRTGRRFRDLLCDKARNGVEVRLLADAIGSVALGRRFLRPLRQAGVEVAFFNPLTLARFRPDLLNFRTHRKITVCDGRIGFTGGINICDNQSAAAACELAWRDTHVLIEGAPVRELQLAFLEDWQFATGHAPHGQGYFPEGKPEATGPWVQTLASGPDDDAYPIEKFCFAAIAGAKRRVLISTPYFVPNDALLSAVTTAAMRGVDVQVLVPERSDSRLVTAAARSYFEDLARAGVRIHEYGPPMFHAKTLVVDDDIAQVGTANMDNRSFRLNFEIAAVFYDQSLAELLAATFEEDLCRARPYRLREARRAPFPQRLAEAVARLLSPVL